MSYIWYRKHGFYNNPFSIKPAAFTDEIVGFPVRDVFKVIDTRKVAFIQGDYGQGKTAILKRIINRYKGKRRLIYYSCNRDDSLDIDGLLKGAGNLFSRILRLTTKDVILLLDEASSLSARDLKSLNKAYQSKDIRSIVFVGKTRPSLPMKTENFKLSKLSLSDAVELVRKRVGDFPMLKDAIIKKVFQKSQRNPRLLLENLEDLCYLADSLGDTEVREEHVKKFFK